MEKGIPADGGDISEKDRAGVVYLRRAGCMLSPLTYWRLHKQYFGGKNQLMYINSGVDGEAAYYVMSEDGFYRLKGYHIYYEKTR